MQQPAQAPFSCRFDQPGRDCLPGEGFCGFEFPWCEGCPQSMARKTRAPDDPIKSAIWRGWINGMAAIRK